MDPTLGSVLSAVLGGGTIAALLNYLQVRRSQKAGVPAKEDAAVVHATGSAGATGADWQALNAYWQAEVARKEAETSAARSETAQVRAEARRRELTLELRNDQLIGHIWTTTGKPPPPPLPTDPNGKLD